MSESEPPIEGFDSARGIQKQAASPEEILRIRRARAIAKRSVLGDAAARCDAKASAIEKAHPGRGFGSVSKPGKAMAAIAKELGDEMWAMRERIGVPDA